MKNKRNLVKSVLLILLCAFWSFPLLWAIITSLHPASMAVYFSLKPVFTLENIRNVFGAAPFLTYGINTLIIVCGILSVQLITVTLGAYALARIYLIASCVP